MQKSLRSWWWVVVVVVAGCGDSPSPNGASGNVLVRVDPATAADCSHGGSVVIAGVDRNGDGMLDGGEISSRTPVCDAAVTVLTRVVAEPAGAHCALGGSAIEAGPDANGNGKLDDGEVSHIDYVCNDEAPEVGVVTRLAPEPPGVHCSEGGTRVESGPDRNGNGRLDDGEVSHVDFLCGDQVLSRFTIEPPGANCVAGGVRIEVGHDVNGNHMLDAGEVEQSGFSCSDVLPGDVVIRSPDDAAALAHIHTIAGSLRVAAPLAELALPDLAAIAGALDVSDVASVTGVSLPALRSAGAVTVEGDAALATLELPMLRSVGSVSLRDLPALQASPIGALQSVHDITVAGTGLTALALDLHAPTSVAGVAVTGNPMLATVTVDDGAIATLDISDNPSLHSVAITAGPATGDIVLVDPALDQLSISGGSVFGTDVGGSLTVQAPLTQFTAAVPLSFHGGLSLEATQLTKVDRVRTVEGKLRLVHNPRLRQSDASLPEVHGGLEIVGNDRLEHVDLLFTGDQNGDVTIVDNPALIDGFALFTVGAVHGDMTVSGNASLTEFPGPRVIDGRLTIENNPMMADLEMFDLTHAGDIAVRNNAVVSGGFLSKLTSVSTLEIANNPVLDLLDLPVLTAAHEVHVDHNHALSTCDVTVIFGRITADVLEQSDNDDAKPCTPDVTARRAATPQ